jgi:ABC-type antimicrobial peptide transport system permease subunit
MKVKDLLQFSFQSFKNRKSRVFFTVAGVAVGISVIIFLISLGYGLQNTILNRITTEEALLSLDVFSPDPESLPLTQDSLDRIGKVSNIDSVSPKATAFSQISYNNLTSEATINLVKQDYFTYAGIKTQLGEFFDKGGNEILVSETIADLLNISKEDIIGKSIDVTISFEGINSDLNKNTSIETLQDEFIVVGILQDSEMLNEIYMHIDDVDQSYVQKFESVKVKVDGQEGLELVRAELTDKGFLVSALSDLAEQANKVFGIIQMILAVFGIFSLLVAAIGLVNTMTISLLERTNEIGIMRAIGASKRDIQKLFLIESTLIGFMGGLSGVVLGWVGARVVNIILNIVARAFGGQSLDIFFTPLWFVLFILASSAFVGFISGVFPAGKASRLNTLEALRYK